MSALLTFMWMVRGHHGNPVSSSWFDPEHLEVTRAGRLWQSRPAGHVGRSSFIEAIVAMVRSVNMAVQEARYDKDIHQMGAISNCPVMRYHPT
ncbi:hypothetical protein FEAC_08990 [Ferrimicrobium acidiphilum DSM 19497]|uniref:Uncharacterized protein n=1 Tax=Ferrimicrobium acidiphilum DSM 19497 TaxID=1121877 RepID=A0A0D8FW10_9ACTN|nr:hypothetical protein FEAC_08990 [Ferrimicrobium acidiphilum DSM 19497]